MNEYRFLDESHQHWLGDRRLPGITEVLRRFQMTNYDPQFFNVQGLARGTQLHAFCAMVDQGQDPEKLHYGNPDHDLKSEVMAYAQWKKATGFQAEIIEEPMHSPMYHFAGIPDVFGKMADGVPAVVERKRGVAGKATALQTAAQVQLISEKTGILTFKMRRFSIQKFTNGRPSIVEYKGVNDRQVFLGLVAAYHWAITAGIFRQEEK